MNTMDRTSKQYWGPLFMKVWLVIHFFLGSLNIPLKNFFFPKLFWVD